MVKEDEGSAARQNLPAYDVTLFLDVRGGGDLVPVGEFGGCGGGA